MTQNYIKTAVKLPNSNESNLFVYVPIAGYTNPGIAMFDEDYFNIDADGKVSINTQGNGSIVTKTYLETNYYDKTIIDTALNNKLNKVTTTGTTRLYGVTTSGDQIMITSSINTAGTIMMRDSNGKSKVSNPFENLDIANKQYVDNYAVQKIATSGSYVRLYGIGQDGTQGVYNATSDANAGSIVRRNANGSTSFAEPTSSAHAATKNYVDTKVASLGTVFSIKGTVATVSALPAFGNNVGDVYFVTADNSEYVWTSSNTWEQFGPTIDINSAIDTRLASKYDIYEGSGLLNVGSTGHNLYFTGDTAITLETADAGIGNGIELYDSYGYNYLRVNSTEGVELLADYKFNISAAGGSVYVRTIDGMNLDISAVGTVSLTGAVAIGGTGQSNSALYYDAGYLGLCNDKIHLDYSTGNYYTDSAINIAIPNLYKTYNQNTMQYSNPYATTSDINTAITNNGIQVVQTSQTYNVNLIGPNANIISYDDNNAEITIGDGTAPITIGRAGDVTIQSAGPYGVYVNGGVEFSVSTSEIGLTSTGLVTISTSSEYDPIFIQAGNSSVQVDSYGFQLVTEYTTLIGTNFDWNDYGDHVVRRDSTTNYKLVVPDLYESYTSASVNNPYVDKQTYDSLVARVAALESALSIQNS